MRLLTEIPCSQPSPHEGRRPCHTQADSRAQPAAATERCFKNQRNKGERGRSGSSLLPLAKAADTAPESPPPPRTNCRPSKVSGKKVESVCSRDSVDMRMGGRLAGPDPSKRARRLVCAGWVGSVGNILYIYYAPGCILFSE
jgi:hypothetical protein